MYGPTNVKHLNASINFSLSYNIKMDSRLLLKYIRTY